MKAFLILITGFLFCTTLNAQSFKLSAQKQILSIHLNEDNSNKILKIDTKERIANVQRLSIRSLNTAVDNGVVRTFQIVSSDSGNAGITFTDDKEPGVFNCSLKDLVDKMGQGTYKIYTLAIPRDVAKAAEAKPKRVLVATLVVE